MKFNNTTKLLVAIYVGRYCWGATPRVSKNEVVTLCTRHTALDAFSQLFFPRTKYYFNLLEYERQFYCNEF